MLRSAAVLMLVVLLPSNGAAQIPEKFDNLQVFPAGTPRAVLVQRMREFSFALGVRCAHCHTEASPGVANRYASDARPAKQQARAMLRMVDTINATLLPALPSHAAPRVTVDCVTCHRGVALPKSLQTTLFEITEAEGAAAAVARYRDLRNTALASGRYNFGEWEINELARRLTEAGRTAEAITILEMNLEFHSGSADIEMMLGNIHRGRGERDAAIARYRAALAKVPEHEGAKLRLAEMEKPAGPLWHLDVEPNHSSVRFSVPVAGGITRVSGVFASADVRMRWDPERLDRWSVDLVIPTATIDTGNDARDADLRGPAFFHATAHPALTFRSATFEKAGDGYVARGNLTVRGVTKAVALPFSITRIDWVEGRPVIGVAIRWQLDRLDFGVGADWRHTLIPNFLGREVSIEIDLWTRAGRQRAESPRP